VIYNADSSQRIRKNRTAQIKPRPAQFGFFGRHSSPPLTQGKNSAAVVPIKLDSPLLRHSASSLTTPLRMCADLTDELSYVIDTLAQTLIDVPAQR
jgi:hypothetical protein